MANSVDACLIGCTKAGLATAHGFEFVAQFL
jgi:hypothetical protein